MSQIQQYQEDMEKDKTKANAEAPKRPTSVDIIKPEINEKIAMLASAKGTSTRKYVNDVLELIIKKEEFISKYLPQIKKIGFDDDLSEMYLRDSKISKSPTISKSSTGFIICDTCDEKIQDSCVHVVYAMTQLEIGRFLSAKKKK